MDISVIIIVKNAERTIEKALLSVKWVDEIIVLDSGSTDDTLEIVRRHTDNVWQTDWPGFGIQKNRALAKAQGRWVLNLDADEYVSDALRTEIQTLIHQEKTAAAYWLPSHSYFLGRHIRFGDWYKDRKLRLFKRDCARFEPVPVHEGLVVDGEVGTLRGHITHDSYLTLDDVLQKLMTYAKAGAEKKHQQNQQGTIFKACHKAAWCFLRGYFLRLGFLDGRYGLLLAMYNAQSTFYRYLYLWERLQTGC